MYNKIILMGNLTKDIKMKYSQGGLAIAKSAVATNRKYKSKSGEQKEEVCFVDITLFARSAEIANQYLRKGSKVMIEGRLQFETWNDPNGNRRSKHSVVVDNLQMLDSKMNAGGVDTHAAFQHQVQTDVRTTTGVDTPSVQNQIPVIDIDEDEIPF